MSDGSADRSFPWAIVPEIKHIKTADINTIDALLMFIMIGK